MKNIKIPYQTPTATVIAPGVSDVLTLSAGGSGSGSEFDW